MRKLTNDEILTDRQAFRAVIGRYLGTGPVLGRMGQGAMADHRNEVAQRSEQPGRSLLSVARAALGALFRDARRSESP